MKAFVEAYGCTLNFGESREIEELLVRNGWMLVGDPTDCDLAVLATCVVIEKTERAMLKRIRELSAVPRLVVTGCMATACRKKAEDIAPDAVFVAPGDLPSLSKAIGLADDSDLAAVQKGRSYAIVPIATGCRGACSYCITRISRGELRSRCESSIVEAVEKMVAVGPREIQLTAQDSAAYGLDIGSSLPRLVAAVCRSQHDFRVRIGMMNPKSAIQIVDQLTEMYSEPKVFKFLHLPVQSASNRLLGDMNREYTVEEFRAIVNRTRSAIPKITLSTDLIVGYPGETAADHIANLELVSDVKPDIVNVTRFSARPGTKAAVQGSPVVGWVAKDRSREIASLRFKVALEKNNGLIGRTVRAMATEPGKKSSTILRTDEYKQVVLPEIVTLGTFHDVVIERATPTYLVGRRSD